MKISDIELGMVIADSVSTSTPKDYQCIICNWSYRTYSEAKKCADNHEGVYLDTIAKPRRGTIKRKEEK